jgi:uncharacterized protein YndB with AHSA1/START domain
MESKANDHLKMEVMIDAPLKKVWQAWTDPDIILQWIGSDPDGKGLNAKLNVRIGGTYEIHFMNSDLAEHTCYGVYNDIVEFSRLHFSWRWKSEPDVESQVSILLIPAGRQTMMQFEHQGFGYQSAHSYAEGWKGAFFKLNRALKKTDSEMPSDG